MRTIRDALNIIFSQHTAAQKANYIRYRLSRKAEVLSYEPVTISIVATGRCTLSCDMCPTHSELVPKDYPHRQEDARDMDLETFRAIIDRFKNALAVHIIGSGEPLLNKDFFRMVDYAASKRMRVKTFSNGTTIAENVENILNSRLDGITIRRTDHDSKEFNRMTGMDERIYEEICAAARRLIAEKKKRNSPVEVKLSFIIDRHNYKFMPRMIALALEWGADHAFLCNFLPCPYDGLRAEERVLLADSEIATELKTMALRYPAEVTRRVAFPVLVDRSCRDNRCETHFSQIRFNGDGNVSSCSMMLLNMAGQGKYTDKGVWNNEFFKNMRRAFLSAGATGLPSPCGVCPDNKGVHV